MPAASGKPAEINVRLPKTQTPTAVSATPFRAGDGLRLLLRVRSAAARRKPTARR